MSEREQGLEALLARAGITKAELGRRIGISSYSVSKWKTAAPRYAMAYLEILIECRRLEENMRALESSRTKK